MGVFDFLKKKDQNQIGMMGHTIPEEAPDMHDHMEKPSGTPTQDVLNFRKQGYTDNQIVQTLQRQGFEPSQIYDALNQAEIMGGVRQAPVMEQMQPQQQMQPTYQSVPGGPVNMQSQEDFEEMAESIIDQKWQHFSGELQKLALWKDDFSSRLSKVEQSLQDVKADLDNIHAAIIGKLTDYDKNLLNIGTEIKAMEKVFQKVIPTFTENVQELAQVTRNLKKN